MILGKLTIGFGVASIGLLFFVNGCDLQKEGNNAGFAFGAIADCQYCTPEGSRKGSGVRKYSLSKEKLTKCVADFNTMDLEYVIQLGDLIDHNFKNFDIVLPIYNQFKMPKYHVLGNHDFAVSDNNKKEVAKKLGLRSKYYDFEAKGWRYVVLNGNDISFRYPENSEEYTKATEYYTQNNIQSPKWNGAIGTEQLAWLQTVLGKATKNGENVIVFCHFPIYPENKHNLWNDKKIIELLESFSCVKAYINGHNHSGGYGIKEGIHYLTLKGMVNTEQTSYAVIRIDGNRIKITGYGREENRDLLIRK